MTCDNACITPITNVPVISPLDYRPRLPTVARLHHMDTNPTSWLDRMTTDSHRAIAQATGLSHTTISRAASTATPPPAVVVAVARACGYNPVDALYHAGLLTQQEAQPYTGEHDLRTISSRVMLQELLRREAGQAGA